mgnify:CR=1 FL=1
MTNIKQASFDVNISEITSMDQHTSGIEISKVNGKLKLFITIAEFQIPDLLTLVYDNPSEKMNHFLFDGKNQKAFHKPRFYGFPLVGKT